LEHCCCVINGIKNDRFSGVGMNECSVVLMGNAVSEVHRHTTSNGDVMARFRMVVHERRYDRTLERYVGGESSYFNVVAWRHTAENVLASVNRGDPVIVSGRLRIREWTSDTGQLKVSSEVSVQAIGHDLSRGRTAFSRLPRAEPSGPQRVSTDAA